MAVLGLLKEQDMHGYELKRRLADVFGLSTAVSFGSLYPALNRLEAAGAVNVVPQPSPEAGEGLQKGEGHASRRRKVYGITALGTALFADLLAGSQAGAEDDRSFNLRLAFARYLPPEGRIGLLEHRRAVLGERLTQLGARALARRDDRYLRILAERERESLARDVSWLDGLIEQERAATRPAGTAFPLVTTRRAGPQVVVPLASASQLSRPHQVRPDNPVNHHQNTV